MNNQFGGYIRSDGRRIYAGKNIGDFEQPGPKAEALLWNHLVDQKKLNLSKVGDVKDHTNKQRNYINWLENYTEDKGRGNSFFDEPLGRVIPYIISDAETYLKLNLQVI